MHIYAHIEKNIRKTKNRTFTFVTLSRFKFLLKIIPTVFSEKLYFEKKNRSRKSGEHFCMLGFSGEIAYFWDMTLKKPKSVEK